MVILHVHANQNVIPYSFQYPLMHAPITAHQRHFQFKICGTINRPIKLSHPVASDPEPGIENQKPPIEAMLIFIILTFRPIG